MFKSVKPSYQLHLYERNQLIEGREPSKPVYMEHDGVKYSLRYIKNIKHVPYEGDVWNLSVEGSPTFQTAVGMSHNTVKPVEIMVKLLGDVPKDALVLDPFLGSGTTGVACLQTGHSFIGIEREAEYLEVCDARIRYWNQAESGWTGAEIVSDAAPVVRDIPVHGDLFDMFGSDDE